MSPRTPCQHVGFALAYSDVMYWTANTHTQNIAALEDRTQTRPAPLHDTSMKYHSTSGGRSTPPGEACTSLRTLSLVGGAVECEVVGSSRAGSCRSCCGVQKLKSPVLSMSAACLAPAPPHHHETQSRLGR